MKRNAFSATMVKAGINPALCSLSLPQMAETNTPQLMDVAGKCLLYYGI